MIFQTAGFIYRNCIVKQIISDFNFMLNKLDPRGSGVEGSAEGALAPPLHDEETLQEINITGGIDNRQWPVGQINKSSLVDYLEDWPLEWLEAYCNISRGIVKQETHQFSNDSLVHNGSVLHYFYNPNGDVDPTKRLIFLIEITLQVHEENCNLLSYTYTGFNTYFLHCATTSWSRRYFGLPKLLNFIQKRDQNGDTILHGWAKKGTDFFYQ